MEKFVFEIILILNESVQSVLLCIILFNIIKVFEVPELQGVSERLQYIRSGSLQPSNKPVFVCVLTEDRPLRHDSLGNQRSVGGTGFLQEG